MSPESSYVPMRALLIALAFFGACLTAGAEPAMYKAGTMRLTVENAAPFQAAVWYPTPEDEIPWRAGPFRIAATRDATLAQGRFPVLLLSHGGLAGGSPLLLSDLSAALARNGFVVVAPFHDATPLYGRTRQVAAAYRAVLADSRLGPHLDAEKVGLIGFSLGGAVALGMAGGQPQGGYLASYCGGPPADNRSCPSTAGGEAETTPRPPIKALALLDPFALLYGGRGLAEVALPVLLIRPQASDLGPDNPQTVRDGLPSPPETLSVPGSHFVFANDCGEDFKAAAPDLCTDPAGTERATVRDEVVSDLVAFFGKTL